MSLSKTVVLVLLVLCVLTHALADDGRIPIWEPTTIDTPGAYVLTRDIDAQSSIAIQITTSDVDLDLNGFGLASDGLSVNISDGVGHVTIRQGRIIGDGAVRLLGAHEAIILEDLQITTVNRALYNTLTGTCDQCRIANNTIRTTGTPTYVIDLGAGQDTEFVNNRIFGSNGYGINLRPDPRGFRIVGNTIQTTGYPCMQIRGTNHLIAENVVGPCGNHGIFMRDGGSNLVLRNTVTDCVNGALASLDADFNHIEGNLLTGSDWGLYLLSDADNNVIRGNTTLDNLVDFEDQGTGNQSHGDNYRAAGQF